jgi:hypothetical protein
MQRTHLSTYGLRAVLSPRLRILLGIAVVVGACASTLRSRDGWFDACCEACEADACSGCNDTKSNSCRDEATSHRARCRLLQGVLTCKPVAVE